MPKLIYDEQKLIEKLIEKVALHPLGMTQADIIPLDIISRKWDGTGRIINLLPHKIIM